MSDSFIVTGQRFGMYTVVEPAEPDDTGHRRWLCRCDCGNVRTVYESSLKRGRGATGCGCGKSPDLSGQRFGKLTVLERSDRRGSRGARKTPLWKCICDCGDITYKATDVLNNPSISMCKRCAEKYTVSKARDGAGYVGGTQISKLTGSSESTNMSGVRGVYFDPKTRKYRARIRFKGQRYNLGSFDSLEAAAEARKKAEDDIFGAFLLGIGKKE